jgi:hypothetical protein
MGGNALKNVVTRRYTRMEYDALKERILNTIRPYVEQCDVPKEFPCKESFGDLDVLLVCPRSIKCHSWINDLFHPTEIVHNGDVYSFDVEQFQIDFILVPEVQFENALVYLSYSDLGGLIGNITHKIGLKYGMQGLWMNVHTKEFDPTTTSTKLLLSHNVQDIFAFLGYDYQRYTQQFLDQDAFFQWITEGKYFRRFYFYDDQLNHAHRQRRSKRPIYVKFLEFLHRQVIDNDNESIRVCEQDEQSKLIVDVRQQALIDFHKQDEYKQGQDMCDRRREFHDKYNGSYFIDAAESKQMIPVLMKNFQKRFADTDDEFHRWVSNTDTDTIRKEIDKYKQELKQTQLS